MRARIGMALLAFLWSPIVGCQTVASENEAGAKAKAIASPPDERSPVQPQTPKPAARRPGHWDKRKLDLLKAFALQEAPQLWQSVQALQIECEARKTGLAGLKNDLLEFGRNPDEDADYLDLKLSCESIRGALEQICAKIEDAYIAYKKFQAAPGRADYENLMRKSLEDGIQEADAASRRYRSMTQDK